VYAKTKNGTVRNKHKKDMTGCTVTDWTNGPQHIPSRAQVDMLSSVFADPLKP